ncbi:MAG TPA: hypothetical protein PKD25_14180 [Rubrivivax sp.]|jgi:hypothetical protein|nr:hypothetical protein [Rubrivivax sp.]
MKTILKPARPRNPFAPAARARHAGAQRRSAGGIRQRAERALRAELARHDP